MGSAGTLPLPLGHPCITMVT